MLDIKLIRENPDKVREGLKAKNTDPKLLDDFLSLDEKWRKITKQSEDFRSEQKKAGEAKDVEKAKALKNQIKELEDQLNKISEERDALILEFPNLPFDDVPRGQDESANQVIRQVGKKPKFDFEPKDYFTLAKELDLIDTEKAGEISGSRFGYLKNEAVLLEFALIDLAMKILVKEGFIPILPPVLVKPEVMKGMGKYKFISEKDAYHLSEDDLYLVGSSEHSIGPYHSNEVLKNKELPKRYVGFSTCFRREAGSYGKDTKGILRVHQFNKVEMVIFSKPEDSEKEYDLMVSLQEKLMQVLGLPYQVVEICTGDSDPTAAKQIDLETWFPGEKRYRETHSCSNTTDYQARGVNTKYETSGGEKKYVHMLNGTVFSERPIIAIIENYQTKDGKIKIPKVLQNYVGKKEIKPKN